MNVFHTSFMKKIVEECCDTCCELHIVTFCFRGLRREDSFVFRESSES
jgi:hypothetical protein